MGNMKILNRILGFTTLTALAVFLIAVGFSRSQANRNTQELRKPIEIELDSTPITGTPSSSVVSYADVLEGATPAVVAVYTARVVRVAQRRSDPREEMLRRFFGLPPSSGGNYSEEDVEERRIPAGVGSGVIVSKDGYILTNNHVITNERGSEVDEILVQLADDREFPAEIVGRDPKTDLAVLKIEQNELPYITMADSDNLRVGDVVFAVGNPLGVGQTVTMGIVSATGRSGLRLLGEQAYENFIQTDASINQGNSGGSPHRRRRSPGRYQYRDPLAIGRQYWHRLCHTSTLARNIMVNLLDDGTIRRGFLGVSISDLDSDIAEAFGLEDTQGALIQSVEPGLPAEQAGIARGDVIVEVDGKSIRDGADLRFTIAQIQPGKEVVIVALRDGEQKTFKVTLADLEDRYGSGVGETDTLLDGVEAEPLTNDLRKEYRIDGRVDGLIIIKVAINSPYVRGLAQGTVIMEINDYPVDTVEEARRVLRRGVNKFWIYARGAYRYIAVRLG